MMPGALGLRRMRLLGTIMMKFLAPTIRDRSSKRSMMTTSLVGIGSLLKAKHRLKMGPRAERTHSSCRERTMILRKLDALSDARSGTISNADEMLNSHTLVIAA